MKRSLVIVDGVRTPFCKAGTLLASQTAADLGHAATTALLARTGIDPALIDEVVFGCVSQPADQANVARVIALRAGIPESVPAVTVHRNCASGFEALTACHEKLSAGQGEVFLAGGTESMTHIPILFPQGMGAKLAVWTKGRGPLNRLGALFRFRPSDFKPIPALPLGLSDPVAGMSMGDTAELVGREHGIDRAAQDAFALRSHRLAAEARERLAEEIAPIYTDRGTVSADNGVRPDGSAAALAKLRPIFDRKGGTVTAGNASQISDGAVALLVMDEKRAEKLGLEPLGRLERYAYAGCDPKRMGMGPIAAIRKAGRDAGEADIMELNEAFAAQALSVMKELGLSEDDAVNPNGGAIALGHPVGATGARLVLTLLRELKRRHARTGLATLCVGGGQGGALWLERL